MGAQRLFSFSHSGLNLSRDSRIQVGMKRGVVVLETGCTCRQIEFFP